MLKIDTASLEAFIKKIVDAQMRALYPQGDDPWYTSDEASTYLGISRGTVRNLVCSGALPRHGVPGTRLRFRRSELDAYAEGRRS
jgi:excisionase family DNA binding protein